MFAKSVCFMGISVKDSLSPIRPMIIING